MFNNMAYIGLLIICSFILILRKNADRKSKKIYDFIICIVLIIFSGFRFNVGTDYPGYTRMFYDIGIQGRYYNIEWGFYGLIKLCHSIGATPQLVFLIYSILTVYFIYLFIDEFSENKEMSWIIFICIGPYFLSTFNGVRQWLSVAMFAYSLKYVKEEKFLKYAIINLISGLSHYSALVLVPFYFILKLKKFNMKKIIFCYFSFMLANLLGILKFITFQLHAVSYLENEASYNIDSSYLVFFIMAICCWLFLKLFKKDEDPKHCILENLNYLSGLTVFLLLTTKNISNMLFIRVNMYFFITYIVFVPILVNKLIKLKIQNLKLITTIIFILFSIGYFLFLTSSSLDLTPYQMNFELFR